MNIDMTPERTAEVTANLANRFMSSDIVNPASGTNIYERPMLVYDVSTPDSGIAGQGVGFTAEVTLGDDNSGVTVRALLWDGAADEYVELPVETTGLIAPERLLIDLPPETIKRAAGLLITLSQDWR